MTETKTRKRLFLLAGSQLTPSLLSFSVPACHISPHVLLFLTQPLRLWILNNTATFFTSCDLCVGGVCAHIGNMTASACADEFHVGVLLCVFPSLSA